MKKVISKIAKTYSGDIAFIYNNDGKKVEVSYKSFESDINNLGTYLYNEGYIYLIVFAVLLNILMLIYDILIDRLIVLYVKKIQRKFK